MGRTGDAFAKLLIAPLKRKRMSADRPTTSRAEHQTKYTGQRHSKFSERRQSSVEADEIALVARDAMRHAPLKCILMVGKDHAIETQQRRSLVNAEVLRVAAVRQHDID